MPDWLRDIVVALIGGLFGAGGIAGLAQIMKARADAKLAIEAQQDEHTLKLYQSLNASEDVFRKAVLGAYDGEVKDRRAVEARLDEEIKARREVEASLRETQKQLTAITGERDLFKRQLEQAQTDLSAAHAKIRHLESEIAQLQAHNQKEMI